MNTVMVERDGVYIGFSAFDGGAWEWCPNPCAPDTCTDEFKVSGDGSNPSVLVAEGMLDRYSFLFVEDPAARFPEKTSCLREI